jgi:hypothetical protein
MGAACSASSCASALSAATRSSSSPRLGHGARGGARAVRHRRGGVGVSAARELAADARGQRGGVVAGRGARVAIALGVERRERRAEVARAAEAVARERLVVQRVGRLRAPGVAPGDVTERAGGARVVAVAQRGAAGAVEGVGGSCAARTREVACAPGPDAEGATAAGPGAPGAGEPARARRTEMYIGGVPLRWVGRAKAEVLGN